VLEGGVLDFLELDPPPHPANTLRLPHIAAAASAQRLTDIIGADPIRQLAAKISAPNEEPHVPAGFKHHIAGFEMHHARSNPSRVLCSLDVVIEVFP
jgi:alpha-beta hydrolase superfamily lysophospholipase